MIVKYLFRVDVTDEVPASRAYAFYSCLLSLLPEDAAAMLHEQGETPVSQFLRFDRAQNRTLWQITLLGESAAQALGPTLDALTCLHTNIEDVPLTLLSRTALTAGELIAQVRLLPEFPRTTLQLLSPIAFKQNGRYTILPEPRLIVQSLIGKWNSTFPDFPLDDPDAEKMLMDGLRVGDISIRSTRYPLKGTRIPGITGSVTLDAALSPPIMEIWKLLAHFAAYSGIGIKTALGMGGAAIKQPQEHTCRPL